MHFNFYETLDFLSESEGKTSAKRPSIPSIHNPDVHEKVAISRSLSESDISYGVPIKQVAAIPI